MSKQIAGFMTSSSRKTTIEQLIDQWGGLTNQYSSRAGVAHRAGMAGGFHGDDGVEAVVWERHVVEVSLDDICELFQPCLHTVATTLISPHLFRGTPTLKRDTSYAHPHT